MVRVCPRDHTRCRIEYRRAANHQRQVRPPRQTAKVFRALREEPYKIRHRHAALAECLAGLPYRKRTGELIGNGELRLSTTCGTFVSCTSESRKGHNPGAEVVVPNKLPTASKLNTHSGAYPPSLASRR